MWREMGLPLNSQCLHHIQELSYDDYYLNILMYCQEYLIWHDYQSLYPNSYHMNWNSTNLYYIICVHAICMYKKFTSIQFLVVQSAFIQSAFIQSVFVQTVFIQSVFIQSVFIQSVSNLTLLSVKKSSSLSGTKTYTGTLNFSTGSIPYVWVHFFFAFGAKKVSNTVPLLSGRWMCLPLSVSEEYEYLCLDSWCGWVVRPTP